MVVEHHDGTVLGSESLEGAVQRDPGGERPRGVRRARLIGRQLTDVGVAPVDASLLERGAHHEPVGPGVEAVEVPQPRQVPPDAHQRALDGILGGVEVAQDGPDADGIPDDGWRVKVYNLFGGAKSVTPFAICLT